MHESTILSEINRLIPALYSSTIQCWPFLYYPSINRMHDLTVCFINEPDQPNHVIIRIQDARYCFDISDPEFPENAVFAIKRLLGKM